MTLEESETFLNVCVSHVFLDGIVFVRTAHDLKKTGTASLTTVDSSDNSSVRGYGVSGNGSFNAHTAGKSNTVCGSGLTCSTDGTHNGTCLNVRVAGRNDDVVANNSIGNNNVSPCSAATVTNNATHRALTGNGVANYGTTVDSKVHEYGTVIAIIATSHTDKTTGPVTAAYLGINKVTVVKSNNRACLRISDEGAYANGTLGVIYVVLNIRISDCKIVDDKAGLTCPSACEEHIVKAADGVAVTVYSNAGITGSAYSNRIPVGTCEVNVSMNFYNNLTAACSCYVKRILERCIICSNTTCVGNRCNSIGSTCIVNSHRAVCGYVDLTAVVKLKVSAVLHSKSTNVIAVAKGNTLGNYGCVVNGDLRATVSLKLLCGKSCSVFNGNGISLGSAAAIPSVNVICSKGCILTANDKSACARIRVPNVYSACIKSTVNLKPSVILSLNGCAVGSYVNSCAFLNGDSSCHAVEIIGIYGAINVKYTAVNTEIRSFKGDALTDAHVTNVVPVVSVSECHLYAALGLGNEVPTNLAAVNGNNLGGGNVAGKKNGIIIGSIKKIRSKEIVKILVVCDCCAVLGLNSDVEALNIFLTCSATVYGNLAEAVCPILVNPSNVGGVGSNAGNVTIGSSDVSAANGAYKDSCLLCSGEGNVGNIKCYGRSGIYVLVSNLNTAAAVGSGDRTAVEGYGLALCSDPKTVVAVCLVDVNVVENGILLYAEGLINLNVVHLKLRGDVKRVSVPSAIGIAVANLLNGNIVEDKSSVSVSKADRAPVAVSLIKGEGVAVTVDGKAGGLGSTVCHTSAVIEGDVSAKLDNNVALYVVLDCVSKISTGISRDVKVRGDFLEGVTVLNKLSIDVIIAAVVRSAKESALNSSVAVDGNTGEAVISNGSGIVTVGLCYPVTCCKTDSAVSAATSLCKIDVFCNATGDGVVVVNQAVDCSNGGPTGDVEVLNGTVEGTVSAFAHPTYDTARHGLLANEDSAHAFCDNGAVVDVNVAVGGNTACVSVSSYEADATGYVAVGDATGVMSTGNRTNSVICGDIYVLNVNVIDFSILCITEETCIRKLCIVNIKVAYGVLTTVEDTLEGVSLGTDRSPSIVFKVKVAAKSYPNVFSIISGFACINACGKELKLINGIDEEGIRLSTATGKRGCLFSKSADSDYGEHEH